MSVTVLRLSPHARCSCACTAKRFLVALIACFSLPATARSQVEIDFDDLLHGAAINSQYQSSGVVFSSTTTVIAQDVSVLGAGYDTSSGNIFAGQAWNSENPPDQGHTTIQFLNPVNSVSLDLIDVGAWAAVVDAYLDDAVVESHVVQNKGVGIGNINHITFTATAITKLIVRHQGPRFDGDGFGFDTLRFVPACWLNLTSHPESATRCPSDAVFFSVASSGTGPLMYLWQWRPESSTAWRDIVGGTNSDPLLGEPAFDAAGIGTPTIVCANSVGNSVAASGGQRELRVVVSNQCGSMASDIAMWTICPADFNCDGFVNGDDYDAFAGDFEQGNAAADINADGFVNGDDYDAFAVAFEAGC